MPSRLPKVTVFPLTNTDDVIDVSRFSNSVALRLLAPVAEYAIDTVIVSGMTVIGVWERMLTAGVVVGALVVGWEAVGDCVVGCAVVGVAVVGMAVVGWAVVGSDVGSSVGDTVG